jgi:hypothetical protein
MSKFFFEIRVESRLWLLLWGILVVVPSFVLVVLVSKDRFVGVFLVRFWWVVTSVDTTTANSNKLRKSIQKGWGISCGSNPRRKVERMIEERRHV